MPSYSLPSSKNPHPFVFSLLSHFCIGLSSTRTMSSVLAGMFLNTSALSRRNMCGPSRSCSFLIWSSLEMSANSSRKPSRLLQTQRQRDKLSSVKVFVYVWLSLGACACLCLCVLMKNMCVRSHLKRLGVRKLSRWKSSSRLFWRGVPVSSSLWSIL